MSDDVRPEARQEEMQRELAVLLADVADGRRAPEPAAVMDALGLPRLLRSLALAEEVIRAADGFHPVARFFAEGGEPQRYILDVLRRSP